jgi:sulfite reductase alpha subunit-like flavoprotein
MEIQILYGSQRGTAEEISMNLEDLIKTKTSRPLHRAALNSITNNIFELNKKTDLIYIICSTTGNGEMPENAFKFWKTIKPRTLPKNLFHGIKYSVLALGDTNYSHFCNGGKQLDKRMFELGAERLNPLCCADDAQDMEETVNKWLNEIALSNI